MPKKHVRVPIVVSILGYVGGRRDLSVMTDLSVMRVRVGVEFRVGVVPPFFWINNRY